ncbi:MAG: hypothetical protein NC390_00515 [Fusobacterium sp.]|nr:hypothetical protein [Fusobacterium sp.]
MIDTIKLMIPTDKVEFKSYDDFKPSLKGFFQPPFYSKGIKAVRNNSKQELLQGRYFPKLTVARIKWGDCLRTVLFVEFSASKILFGNNFEELEDADFDCLLEILSQKLQLRNVIVPKDILRTADVNSVHYSKNFELCGASSRFIINTISKICVPKVLDFAQTDYRNDGIAVKFHTNTYELTFYDKIADLKQSLLSDKRSIEPDNVLQTKLLNDKNFSSKEILRMEVRLNSRKKIKDILNKCEINLESEQLSFENLFSISISKSVLDFFWRKFIRNSFSTICLLQDSNYVLQEKMLHAGINSVKTFMLMGIIASIKETGTRLTKELLKSHNYARYKKYFEMIDFEDTYLFSQFMDIQAKLHQMMPLRLL